MTSEMTAAMANRRVRVVPRAYTPYTAAASPMADYDFRVEMIGHASLRAHCRGKTLVTDPWWIDPLAPHSAAHFPPLVHDVDALAAATDILYISHIHPDHFHPRTLARFRKDIPVYIAAHRRKEFRDKIARLGFPVVECPFNEIVAVGGTDFEIAMIEHDYEENAAYDSSVVVRTPDFTLFDNNDCVLAAEKYRWVRENFRVDYAFLGYSPASFFPICFEMDARAKQRLLAASAERRYGDFVDAAMGVEPAVAIPFASGARFLETGERWKNVAFNSAAEATRRVCAAGIRGEVMAPGDRIDAAGTFHQRNAPPPQHVELAAIESYAQTAAARLDGIFPPDPPVRPGVVERFRDYLLDRWRATGSLLPGVRQYVIAYEVGDERFYFDFSKPADTAFARGTPERYDMRYRYPAAGLQRKLDGEIDWDDLHFSRGVAVHQNRYAREFFMMLRSEMLDLG